ILRLEVGSRAINGTVDGQEAVAVGQFHKLRNDDASQPKSHVHLPDRAGSAILSEVKRGRIESLGDVARFIDSKKKERDPLRTGSLQRRQAMAGLLERYSEARSEAIDVVAHRVRFAQEGFVGHQKRSGEIVRKFDVAPRETCSRVYFVNRRQLFEQLMELDQAHHMSELEDHIGVIECLRQVNDAVFLVIYAQCLRHLLDGAPLDT